MSLACIRFALGVAAWAIIFLIGAAISRAQAHDEWLDGHKVDPVTKNLCCGENDCKLKTVHEVHVTAGGYHLDDTNENIPWDRVQPSPDGGIWACRWGGETKCFFAPPQSF